MSGLVVTAVGAVTPAGSGLQAVRAALAPAEEREPPELASWTLDDGTSFETRRVPGKLRRLFDPPPARLSRLDRYPRLFLAAGLLCLRGLALDETLRERCGVAVGSSFGCWGVNEQYHRGLVTRGARLSSPLHFGYTVPGSAAGELSIASGLRGPNATWVSGRASGLLALGEAMRWLQEGRCDAVVAGASDAQGPWLARELRDAGWSSGRAGEGAIAMLLERAEQAQRAGRRPLLHLSAARSWFDPSLQGDAWTPPGTLSPLAGSLGDCFAVEGLLQLALAGEGSPESVSVQGSCGHGASVTITTGGI